jgi:2-(1,2-epoxy-1,2-dihydrophenyl)acetyl-CoA isomerase
MAAVHGPEVWSPAGAADALYRALAGGDRDALDGLLHPDFVGETTPGLPLGVGGTHRGPTAMRRRFWGPLGRAFDVTARPTGMASLDDGRLMVTGRYVGTARATGATLDAPFVHVLAFDGRRIVGLVQVTDSQQWCAALAGPGGPGTGRDAGAPDPGPGDDPGSGDDSGPGDDPGRGPVRAGVAPAAQPADHQPADQQAADQQPAAQQPADPGAPAARLTVEGGLGHLRLARPDAANSIDLAMVADLDAAARRCAADPDLRALLITGEGARFCAGGDITLFARDPAALPDLLDDMIGRYHRALATIAGLAVPVVAAVQGAVAGGGLGLLFAADVVIAAEGTRFAIGYPSLGLVADGAATWYLPRLVGPARAALMFFDNRVLDAATALEWGLVSEVVAPGDLDARATEIARRLAAGPTRALAHTRRLLRQAWTTTLDGALDAERRAIVDAATTTDAAEGVAAFVARRPPAFEGR